MVESTDVPGVTVLMTVLDGHKIFMEARLMGNKIDMMNDNVLPKGLVIAVPGSVLVSVVV